MNVQPEARMSQTNPLYWSVRRELWENRSTWLAPLIVAAVVLVATMLSTLVVLATRGGSGPVTQPFKIAPAPIMFAALIVGFFYCLDALYSERRDRSILFWKSLPVSDRTTVLSKMAIPVLVLPAIAYVLSVVAQLVLLFFSTALLLGSGSSPVPFWTDTRFFEGLLIMFYGLAVHALWLAPVYAWFLLISAWARRAPVLWAILPLLAVSAVERILFNSWHFMHGLQYRLTGAMQRAFTTADGNYETLGQLSPGKFLATPGLWVGLALAAVFLAAAIRLRRAREPI